MDGLDFYPIELSVEGCEPVEIGMFAADFWQAEADQSCEEENGVGSPVCVMFTTYYTYIETPFMVIVPYEDTSMEVFYQIIKHEKIKSTGAPMHSSP